MIEILITSDMSAKAARMLRALADTAPSASRVVRRASNKADLLVLQGVGHPARSAAAAEQRARGAPVAMWDLGYLAQNDIIGAMRFSVNELHPQTLLHLAPIAEEDRWTRHGVPLREDYDPKGPIILVGLGPKTRAIIPEKSWELMKFNQLRRRFPHKNIIFRPKPRRSHPQLPCATDANSPIEKVLKGASMVVVRHSNVAVDAVIAGIPVEASDGAVKWLDGKPYSVENRLEFLQRLMHFNWRPEEAKNAWKMILLCASTSAVEGTF